MPPPRVFLIDGTAFAYRAFYAVRSLSTSDGRPTNAVFGFATTLQALRDKERPDGLAVAFDVGKPTFRHKKFEEYKAQRKPMPDPLIAQLPVIKRLLAAYRVPVYELEGYEAEDVLGTAARGLAAEGAEVFLVTGDKDALQLVNSHVKVYNPQKDNTVFDAEAVKARYGLGPDQLVDLMALMGDTVDNIPSVPGIGEKTAAELIHRFGTVDELYRRLDEVESPSRRKALERAREQVVLSRELARIDTQAPVTVRLSDIRVQEPDWRALRVLFRELQFKRLLAAVDAKAPAAEPSTGGPGGRQISSARDIASCLARAAAGAAIACWPVSGPGDGDGDAEPVAVLMALAGDEAPVSLIRLDAALLATDAGRQVAAWCGEAAVRKIGHDLKTAHRLLSRFGVTLRGIAGDTMIAAYLVNPARMSQPLSDLADELLECALAPVPRLSDDLAGGPGAAPVHACADALAAIRALHAQLAARLAERGLAALYHDIELPLIEVLARMEAAGIAVDTPYLKGVSAQMAATLAQLAAEIEQLAGGAFNVNSPKQLAQVLFERLGLPVIKRTKTGPSTDSDVLRQLAEKHPLPKLLMRYRELSKLVSTYVDALPQMADAAGRIHTSFNQAATATGRLSSSDPNLQNIPIRTELGRSIRRAFVPGAPDGALVAADYSQIELRILAHLSGDEQLTEAFRQHRDIHRYTASLIYGIPEPEVQPEQRSAMKAVNFGILYGMSAHGLSKELGMSFEEAQTFIDAYFARYPLVRAYLDGQIAQAKREGFVQTLLGRRRYIPEVNSADPMLRQVGERMAVNAPVQGTAADIIKLAMVRLDRELERSGLASRMVLQVHDELVFDAPRAEVPALAALARRVMEGAVELSVPLTVTVKSGANWLDLSPVA